MAGGLYLVLIGVALLAAGFAAVAVRRGRWIAVAGTLAVVGGLGWALIVIGDDPARGWDGLGWVIAGVALLISPGAGGLVGLLIGAGLRFRDRRGSAGRRPA